MIGKHTIYCQGRTVGDVIVSKTGMFYDIDCLCEVPGDSAHILWAIWDNHSERLGLCAFGERGYGLRTTLSTKKTGEGTVRFVLRKRNSEQSIFYVDDLKDAYSFLIKIPNLRIAFIDGRMGIIMRDEGLQDNDRIL